MVINNAPRTFPVRFYAQCHLREFCDFEILQKQSPDENIGNKGAN